jgi:hypothetical protein
MKRITSVAVMWVVALAVGANSWQASAGQIIGDKEWYQPADLLGYSWNDFNAICGGGACNGLLSGMGPDLTGWTWASIHEVGELFAATSPHPGGISTYQAPQAQPFYDFANATGFTRTTDDMISINFGFTGIAGFSSTLAPGDATAYYGDALISLGFPQGPPAGSRFSTASTASLNDDQPYIGGWLYRAAEVPVPATVWLIALGLAALRWSRYRIA